MEQYVDRDILNHASETLRRFFVVSHSANTLCCIVCDAISVKNAVCNRLFLDGIYNNEKQECVIIIRVFDVMNYGVGLSEIINSNKITTLLKYMNNAGVEEMYHGTYDVGANGEYIPDDLKKVGLSVASYARDKMDVAISRGYFSKFFDNELEQNLMIIGELSSVINATKRLGML